MDQLKFQETTQIKKIPIQGVGNRLITRARKFSTCYANESNCSKAVTKELKALVDCVDAGVVAACEFECQEGITCEFCKSLRRPACPGTRVGIEFFADTGSEEDFISRHDKTTIFPASPVQDATKPVSLMTANGPALGDKSVTLTIPELEQ